MNILATKKAERLLQIPDDYTVVDIETTGFKPGVDNIIEIAALKVKSSKVVDEYSTLIYRKEILSPVIIKLTGITSDMLLEGQPIEKAIVEFLDFLGDDVILGHNIEFDIGFLSYETDKMGKPLNNDFVDTLFLSKQALPNVSNKLEDLVKILGIDDNDIHHRALADCYHTYRLANKLLSKDLTIVNEIPTQKIRNKKQFAPTDKTKAINKLNGILIGITCDDILSDEEILSLNSWLNDNRNLAGNYPFDIIYSAVNEVLKDGIVDESEREYLIELFKETADPLGYTKNKFSMNDFQDKIVCLSGEFSGCSKAEFAKALNDIGAFVKDTVTRKTEVLIVGDLGSEQWACGNYGNKVKKALEMQEQGFSIIILNESDIRMNKKMCEQLCLEEEKTIESIITEALNIARDKYGYYKAHEKGYYELKESASEQELYDILKYSLNKDSSISVLIDNMLFFKVNEKQNSVFIKFEAYKALFPLETVEQVEQPVGFVKMGFKKENFNNMFENVLTYTIKNYFPSHRFGCCSKYEECSDAKRCLHEDKFYAKGCYYRENLEKGKIFYGKNANI